MTLPSRCADRSLGLPRRRAIVVMSCQPIPSQIRRAMSDLDPAAVSGAATAALGDERMTMLEQAGVLEYVLEALAQEAEEDDLRELLAPLLLDAGVASDEQGAEQLCNDVLKGLHELRISSETNEHNHAAAQVLRGGPVSMNSLVLAEEKAIEKAVRSELKAVNNYNSEMGKAAVNTPIGDGETEEEMKARFKMARKGEKLLKRAARREKLLSMQRDEFMQSLTREPVVLHWRGGGGATDILLKEARRTRDP
eukprot:6193957-Pleurochrysis_carterae.AAC.2